MRRHHFLSKNPTVQVSIALFPLVAVIPCIFVIVLPCRWDDMLPWEWLLANSVVSELEDFNKTTMDLQGCSWKASAVIAVKMWMNVKRGSSKIGAWTWH